MHLIFGLESQEEFGKRLINTSVGLLISQETSEIKIKRGSEAYSNT